MQRKFSFQPGEYYHIYNRGIEKRAIFKEKADWQHFQHLLYLCNGNKPLVFKLIQGSPLDIDRGEPLLSLVGYALMPNHFHLIVRENREGGITKFMSRLSTAYSMYFNTKYERSGGLFCKPYRAKPILGDEYFQWLISYIHLNPLGILQPDWKEKGLMDYYGARNFIKDFTHSSYPDYFSEDRVEGKLLDKSALPIKLAALERVEDILSETKLFQGSSLE